MTELPTNSAFEQQLNGTFIARTAAGALELKLIEVKEINCGAREATFRAPISLIFYSDSSVILGQDTYTMDHPEFGCFQLFITPVISGKPHPYYEAIIS